MSQSASDPADFNKPLRIPVSCGRCVMWGDDKDAGQRFRKCRAIAHGVVKFTDDWSEILVDNDTKEPIEAAYVEDGSGYYAALKTAENFGCSLFTLPKPTLTLD